MTTQQTPTADKADSSGSSFCSSVCSRSACEQKIVRCVRIWNNPSSYPGYRDYCDSCGWKIIQFNRESKDDIQLRYEVLQPFRDLATGAKFRYPNSHREWIKMSDEGFGIIAEHNPKFIVFGRWGGQQICSAKERVEDECLVWTFL